jgi:multidrug efflux pump subunit AcrB
MNRLTDFSMKNIAAVFIMIVLLTVGGLYSAGTLKVESMPDISFPVVMIATQYNAPPQDVLEQVTEPIEKSLNGLKGMRNLTSSSSDNYSQIIIEFENGVDLDKAKQDVESLVANARLPQSAEKPRVMTFGFASQPVYYMAIYGENGMNQTELDKIYNNIILPGFNGITGIDHVDSIGNNEAQVTIRMDAGALNQYGLSPATVSGMIKAALLSSPAGQVEFDGRSEMIRVRGAIHTLYDLEHLPLTTPAGESILLKQIAKVVSVTESEFIARLDNKPAIGIHLYKTSEANAVEFGEAADRLIAEWERTIPNIKFHTIYNAAVDIKHSIDGMVREGGLGAILASIMILVFLRNFRMTLIVLVSIPLSILITLILMSAMDISLNIMTLGGMAIAVGRVVDDSIVVIENIYSQLQRAHERNESVIKMATSQVSSAITSSTLTTVGVFGPIGMISGVVGEVFRPFALTLASALLSSLLVALTVIPMMAKLMVMNQKNIPVHDESKIGKFMRTYKKMLVWSLNNRIKTLLAAGLMFVLTVVLVLPNLASTFMPESEADRQMYFMIQMPRETSFETMNAQMQRFEEMLLNEKDVNGNPKFTYVESLVGYDFGGERVPYRATLFTEVNEHYKGQETLNEYKQRFLNDMPAGSKVDGMLITFSADTGSGADFSYSLKGDDLQNLQYAAQLIKEKMETFPELSDIKDTLGESKMEVEVVVDANKARIYGLSPAQVMEAVHTWTREEELGDFKFDNVTYETTLEMDRTAKDSLADIESIPIRAATGVMLELKDIAQVREVEAPVTITREQQMQVVNVTAKIDGVDKGGISLRIAAELHKIELPPGVSRDVSGVSDDIAESFGQMYMAMLASIFIVYLVMVIAFGNASAPFAILFSLPLAAIGGLIGLLVTGESLNVTSLIGFLMLIGIVVTNAIVLIDRVQQLREQGMPVREALIEGGMIRFRPIIMTAGATIFALMPLALGMSEGALISKGLAVVVIGGLTTSTLLTLVVVPIVYELIDSFKRRVGRLFRRKQKPAAKTPAGDPLSA